jgi:hypothetical protein
MTPGRNKAGQLGGPAHGPRGPNPPGPCRPRLQVRRRPILFLSGLSYTKDQVLFQDGFESFGGSNRRHPDDFRLERTESHATG